MKSRWFEGTRFEIPDNIDFRYTRETMGRHVRCELRSTDNMCSENFMIDLMEAPSTQIRKIQMYISKLQQAMYSPSIASLGTQYYAAEQTRLHVRSGYDPYSTLGDELSQMSNQINNIKKQSKKLLLLS